MRFCSERMRLEKRLLRGLLPLFLLAAAALLGPGCATAESDNASATPWNKPKSWEYGLPGMNDLPR